jgi:hypothetical protein
MNTAISSANAGNALMLMNVKKPATKKIMAALENVSFHDFPKSKKIVPMHMHSTICTHRQRNRKKSEGI